MAPPKLRRTTFPAFWHVWISFLGRVFQYGDTYRSYPISVHWSRSVPGNVGPLHEPAKFMTGSPPVPKKSVKNASATTSTLGSSQTDASVPPSCPKLVTLAA